MADARLLTPLSREESLRLLQSVSLGRVVFTHLALPAIRPVNHLVEDGRIVIRAQPGTSVAAIVEGEDSAVVAYEADLMDPHDHFGWSVIVVGRAQRVTDPDSLAGYRRALRPWVAGSHDDIIAIKTDMVDGFRVGRDDGPPS